MPGLIWLRLMLRAVWEEGKIISSVQLIVRLSANARYQPCCSIIQYFYAAPFDECVFRLVPLLIAQNFDIKKHNANIRFRRSDCG